VYDTNFEPVGSDIVDPDHPAGPVAEHDVAPFTDQLSVPYVSSSAKPLKELIDKKGSVFENNKLVITEAVVLTRILLLPDCVRAVFQQVTVYSAYPPATLPNGPGE
jgi:hypothetical protein